MRKNKKFCSRLHLNPIKSYFLGLTGLNILNMIKSNTGEKTSANKNEP
jgi:hypothetical protein